jgi:hypothetical protein
MSIKYACIGKTKLHAHIYNITYRPLAWWRHVITHATIRIRKRWGDWEMILKRKMRIVWRKPWLFLTNMQLGLTFKESDIDNVQVGRPRLNATRAIIVKFTAYWSKVYYTILYYSKVYCLYQWKLRTRDKTCSHKKIFKRRFDILHVISDTYCIQQAREEHKDKDCLVWTIDGVKLF